MDHNHHHPLHHQLYRYQVAGTLSARVSELEADDDDDGDDPAVIAAAAAAAAAAADARKHNKDHRDDGRERDR